MGQLAEARVASRRSSVTRTVATTAARLAWSAGGRFWLGMIGLAALTGVIAPASAWVLKQLIDQLTTLSPASSVGLVVGLAVAVVALNSVSLALSSLSSVTAAACQRTMSVAVAADLYAAVNRIQGLSHFERPAFQDDLRLAERAAEETPTGLTTLFPASHRSTAIRRSRAQQMKGISAITMVVGVAFSMANFSTPSLAIWSFRLRVAEQTFVRKNFFSSAFCASVR